MTKKTTTFATNKIIRVVSTFTTIQGSGQVDLEILNDDDDDDDRDFMRTMTIGDIKQRVESLTGVNATQQSIWWKGYILDDDTQTIHDAIHPFQGDHHHYHREEEESKKTVVLTLYMTVPVEERYQKRPSTISLENNHSNHVPQQRRHRLSSWDFKLEDVKLLLEQKTSFS